MLKYPLPQEILTYLTEHKQEHFDLTLAVARIPAPSHHEERRATFCLDYLHKNGLNQAYIDEAENVVCPIGIEGKKKIVIFAGHLDVVFPDTTELPVVIKNGRVYAPGITDDTVNATGVMMMAKMVHDLGLKPDDPDLGLLFVMNSCEEGLGNLKGTRKIFADYGDRAVAFYTFDGFYDSLNNEAVGSMRYELEFLTEGGHSYVEFGNKSAIHYMANLITTLCQIPVPKEHKTTFNIGKVEGGTSVNTIAQQAKMMYEFRSCGRECLAFMNKAFLQAVEAYRAMGITINLKLLGERPCSADVDQTGITQFVQEIVAQYHDQELDIRPGSTDCNIPLSLGIPAVCTGVCLGFGMHTREEWMDIQSLDVGLKIAATIVNHYAK